MKVLFIHSQAESIGVEMLSSALKNAGYDVNLLFDPLLFRDEVFSSKFLSRIFDYKDQITQKAISLKPKLICFSVISDTYSWALEVARSIKRISDVPIIFGGIHPTSVPEIVIANDCVDMLCIGEGDEAIVELVDSLANEKLNYSIKNIWFKKDGNVIRNPIRPLVDNLDSLPFKDNDLFRQVQPDRYAYITMTSRGCLFECSYCCNSVLKKLYKDKGKYVRRRSVENILGELRQAKEKYNLQRIIFHNEVFASDMKWLKEFSERYPNEVGLPYFCWVHPGLINQSTVNLLKKSGCVTVELGIQSWSSKIREEVLNRHIPNEQIIEAIKLLQKENIYTITDEIFGLPKLSIGDIEESAKMHNSLRIDLPQIYWLRYYPNTRIMEYAIRQGIITERQMAELNNSLDTNQFTCGGDTYDRPIAKLISFITAINLFPRFFARFILKNKLYCLFPPLHPLLLNAISTITLIMKCVFWKKKFINTYDYKKNYIMYAPKIIFSRLNLIK